MTDFIHIKATRRIVLLSLLALTVNPVFSQVLMSGGAYSQNFDSLGNASGTWVNNSTLPGWYSSKGSADSTSYTAGTGVSSTGAIYSFGTNGVNTLSERALGSVASSGNTYSFGVRFLNNTAFAQTNITISYAGEQWRSGSVASQQALSFSYQISDSPITNTYSASGWSSFAALDFVSPNLSAISAALDGNSPGNRQVFTNIVLENVVVQPGQELFIRWQDMDDSGFDSGLAIDNLTFSFSATEANTNSSPPSSSNSVLVLMTYNVNGNGTTNWSTNAPQVQAIGRQLIYLQPDIVTFNEIPYTNTYQMTYWMQAFLPGYFLATNSVTDGSIRSVIASRYPIARSQSWMPHTNLSFFGYSGVFARDLFEAQINVPDYPQPLHVFVAHLKATTGSNAAERQDDADQRAAEAAAVSNFFANVFLVGTNKLHPYVLLGDMNEDILRPGSYNSGRPIQKLVSAPTGLKFTTPLNSITHTDYTESIRSSLNVRFDYILPCALLFSNITDSQIFRTDLLNPVPPNLNSNDDKVASDHLPVLMTFANPYEKPFRITTFGRTNSGVNLQWESVPGQPYRIESSSNLLTWSSLITNVVATNYNVTFTSNSVPGDLKFFRVRRGW